MYLCHESRYTLSQMFSSCIFEVHHQRNIYIGPKKLYFAHIGAVKRKPTNIEQDVKIRQPYFTFTELDTRTHKKLV